MYTDRFRFTGFEIRAMMHANHLTIRALAARAGLTQKRIRHVRDTGIVGHAACDWFEAITGALSDEMRSAYRAR